MLTTKQAAEQLHVSVKTVHRWIDKGALVAVKYPSGMVRISQETVDQFIEKARTDTADTRSVD